MPIQKVAGGYRWGDHGKIYRGKGAKEMALRQAKAAFASGYKGKKNSK